jgi:hypothetical protein
MQAITKGYEALLPVDFGSVVSVEISGKLGFSALIRLHPQ